VESKYYKEKILECLFYDLHKILHTQLVLIN